MRWVAGASMRKIPQDWCKPCRRDWRATSPEYAEREKKRKREAYEKNTEHKLRLARKSMLKRKYHITFEQFDRILVSQGGCCALCKTINPGGKGTWHVDHDHKTGVVRGLLCIACNVTLGVYERFEKPIGRDVLEEYLSRNATRPQLRVVA